MASDAINPCRRNLGSETRIGVIWCVTRGEPEIQIAGASFEHVHDTNETDWFLRQREVIAKIFGVTAKLTLLKEWKTEDFSLAKDRERVLKSPYPENVLHQGHRHINSN